MRGRRGWGNQTVPAGLGAAAVRAGEVVVDAQIRHWTGAVGRRTLEEAARRGGGPVKGEIAMWMMVGAIAVVALLALVLKVMERRASKDALPAEDMPLVDMRGLGRGDPYGGGGDGGGGGW